MVHALDGDDDFLGYLVPRSKLPYVPIIANANYYIKRDTNFNTSNGGVTLVYHTAPLEPGDYPPTLVITGPGTVTAGVTYTWAPYPSGLATPYQGEFLWSGPFDGYASALTMALYSDTTINVEITDALGTVYRAEHYVTVVPPEDPGCEPGTCTRKSSIKGVRARTPDTSKARSSKGRPFAKR